MYVLEKGDSQNKGFKLSFHHIYVCALINPPYES